jgi:hypothetical protein
VTALGIYTDSDGVPLPPDPLEADPYDDTPSPLDPTRRTWAPVNLDQVLDGTYQPPEPTVGSRNDGIGLFYPGRQHTIAAESEGGKTWLVLAQAVVELDRGNAVVFLDFEDDEGGVIGRLLACGAKKGAIRDRFAYIRPEEPIGALGNKGDLEQALGDLRPTLAALDGVTEAMTMHGLDPLNNKDAATFGRAVPRYIADHGPATVSLDHLTKNPEGRGRYALGAVHKLNGLNGAAYLLENRHAFGVGLTGTSTILIAKDRPGQLRRSATRGAGDRHWFGDLTLLSHDETFVETSITPPTQVTGPFRPTVLMTKVSEALTKAADPLTSRGVLDRVKGKRDADVRQAIAVLVDEGYITVETGSRGAQLHRLIKPFTGDADA